MQYCKRRNSPPNAMVIRRRNINAKSVPVTSISSRKLSPAAKARPQRWAARPKRSSSVECKIDNHQRKDSARFFRPDRQSSCRALCRNRGQSLPELLCATLTDAFDKTCWGDLRETAKLATAQIEAACTAKNSQPELEIVSSVFYRGRGAYLVGRLLREGQLPLPIALCLRHENERGIILDALLDGDVDLAILFSFTRSYFRVAVECPYRLVRYLQQLMPRKRLIDLYNAIGFHRHGKTEFYRDFISHLRKSSDRFGVAEGGRGTVIGVFTAPTFDVASKLLKDQFDLPKNSTPEDVRRRYRLVFEHDRAGRLVEAHEFEHLRIPADRFDSELLAELLRDADSIVKMEGSDVVIAHAYVERRLRPLNLFFRENETDAIAAAGRDYGQS